MKRQEGEGKVWESIRNASRRDRQFFDNLALLVWCECKAGCTTKSRGVDDWADMELGCYSAERGAVLDGELGQYFTTPRKKMGIRQLRAVQRFIDGSTFLSVQDAKEKMRPFFGDCIASALNVLA